VVEVPLKGGVLQKKFIVGVDDPLYIVMRKYQTILAERKLMFVLMLGAGTYAGCAGLQRNYVKHRRIWRARKQAVEI
jgi:hypothetical protein